MDFTDEENSHIFEFFAVGVFAIRILAQYTFKNYGKRLCSKCAEAEKKKKESVVDENNENKD